MFDTLIPENERDLPYVFFDCDSSVIGAKGAALSVRDVRVSYAPDSLPLDTPVNMMVSFLKSGFKIGGKVALSPQVTISYGGNHTLHTKSSCSYL